MEQCGCVVLAVVFLSLNAFAQPLTTTVDNETNSKLPPFIFPKENVTVGSGLPPTVFPTKNVTVGSGLPPTIFPTKNVTVGSGLPPMLFPTENVTIGSGLPPLVFPTENVTVGDSPVPINTTAKPNETVDKTPPLIFPKSNVSVPLIELPPLIFPDDTKTPINETALAILNAATNSSHEGMHILEEDYYNGRSSESNDDSDEVEEVQPNDNSPQKDNLEENYKSEMKLRPVGPMDDFVDDIEVDHPMLKNSHIVGIIGAVVAALCVCLYVGIVIWRRVTFNRYGMRERGL